jgi:Zn-dependent M28 family amino/carboxypeptidase
MIRGILLFPLVALAAGPDYVAEGNRWWSHIEVLAADSMEGRNTGSEGYRKAAAYVTAEFERAGLKPAGTKGYSQPMTFNVRQIVEAESGLALVRNGSARELKLGDEANIGVRAGLPSTVEAPLVFVGHGLVIPEARHNDLAGLDLKGKIAVFLSGGPASIPGPLKAHYSSVSERWKTLSAAGAIGVVAIPNPKSMDVPWERATLARLQPAMSLSDPAFDESRGVQVSVTVNPARAEKLFEGAGHTFAEILALADASKPLPRFDFGTSLRARASFKKWTVESQNIAGVLEGSDSALKNEYVVFSAHLDHLGIGEPIDGDRIFNGAMDDASGIASLIEIARMLRDQHAKLRRSVMFLAVTGEEKGLQGSKFFAARPTVRPDSIVADVNMDMFLPLFPLKMLEVQGATESTLGGQIKAACAKVGVELQNDKEPDRNLFIRSDQYSFIRAGVPALAFKFGYLKGTPEESVFKDWYKNRYHALSDDLTQPVDKAAAAQFNHILFELAQQVANADARPQWNDSSFFKRFAKYQ